MKKRFAVTHFYYTELNGHSPISVRVQEFVAFPAHRHDFCEFEYVLEGRSVTNVNGVVYPLEAGDVVYVTPADIHGYEMPAKEPLKVVTVHFNLESFSELSALRSGVFRCSKDLRDAFSLLLKESQISDGYSGQGVKNMLERILILANREGQRTAPIQQPLGLSAALAFIHKNFREKITTEEICKACGYSASALCRNFREQTGMTVVAYINKHRLDYAQRMLLTLDDSVGDICFACGFSSVRQFNRVFKETFGSTPSEYRTSHRGRI